METARFLLLLDDLFELEDGTISEDCVLQDISGWNSLNFLGLIVMIDQECGVTVAPASVLECRTVGDLIVLVRNEMDGEMQAA